MRIPRKIWIFAIVYMALSLFIEAVLIFFGGLRVPEDNQMIAPIILIIAPVLAALTVGFRKLKSVLLVSFLAGIFTLVISVTAIKITGLATGFIQPIFVRFVSGFLAALITHKVSSQ